MKLLSLILVLFVFTSASNAGVIGWFSSETRSWDFIQKSGGISISIPIQKDGKTLLPINYWPEGNSGLATRKIDLKKKGMQLVIRVVTQLVEKGSDTAKIHYVDLSHIAAGPYEVYYETAGDPVKYLGKIEIK